MHTIEGHLDGVRSVAYSSDGKVLASGSADGTLRLWDAAGKPLRSFVPHKGTVVRSVAFGPEGDLIASGGDNRTIRLSTALTGQEIREMTGHEAEVESVSFSKDGKWLASGSRDRTVRLWDVDTGKERAILRGHRDAVLRVCFAPDGKTVASASQDRTIRIWDITKEKTIHILSAHHKEVRGLSFSPDGKTLASGSSDQRICFWNAATGKEIVPQSGHQDRVSALGFAQPGTLVSVGQDGTIRWWDWKNGKQSRQVACEALPLRATAFAPGIDMLALGSQKGGIRMLDTKTGKELAPFQEDVGPIRSVAFSLDAKSLASLDADGVRIWDVATKKILRRLTELPEGIQLVLPAPHKKRLFLAGGAKSYLWDVAADKVIHELPLPFERLKSAAYSPDGRLLACGDMDGTIHIWDPETGSQVRTLTGLAGYVHCLAVSPDGRLLCAGGWRCIKVWELETALERCQFRNYEGDAFSISFSPDGRVLASGIGDLSILIWDVTGGALSPEPGAQELAPLLWKNLAAQNGARVHQAVWGLVARPKEAVPLLKANMKRVPALEGGYLDQLVKDLGAEAFAAREKATRTLQKLGDLAEPALRQILIDPPSLEVRRRAEAILQKLAQALDSPEHLQMLRGIEALEHMRTADAQSLLKELSRGAPTARITRAATASLERLALHAH
ncbi:MAG: PQQ-binding-like beta-propeller repeat protein [Gemmataceae bacterium]|nr:PQQ-binding-like beta-propeller repeat protein [Gemmataceae bacterium]